MSKEFTKEEIIQNKKEAIRSLNKTLEHFINDPSGKHLKKANLISYWLKTYSRYLVEEEYFDPTKLISYKRGNVIKANFGFNTRSEHGGLHYAVVLDNNNLHNSPVVTVIPLSSGTLEETYRRDVYIGNELYTKLKLKHASLSKSTNSRMQYNKQLLEALKSSETTDPDTVTKLLTEITENIKIGEKEISALAKYSTEIQRMKTGSIAMMEQIRTISKQRIYVPRSSEDLLYGISLSPESMSGINEQFVKLFTFSK